jgi:hypothetical protein
MFVVFQFELEMIMFVVLQFESEMIMQLDALVEQNKGDAQYKELFHEM